MLKKILIFQGKLEIVDSQLSLWFLTFFTACKHKIKLVKPSRFLLLLVVSRRSFRFYVDLKFSGLLIIQFSVHPGYYCLPELVTEGDPTSVRTPCPSGYFCPNGTGHNWQPCPAGTYSPTAGLRSVEECTPCSAGHFCQGQ